MNHSLFRTLLYIIIAASAATNYCTAGWSFFSQPEPKPLTWHKQTAVFINNLAEGIYKTIQPIVIASYTAAKPHAIEMGSQLKTAYIASKPALCAAGKSFWHATKNASTASLLAIGTALLTFAQNTPPFENDWQKIWVGYSS